MRHTTTGVMVSSWKDMSYHITSLNADSWGEPDKKPPLNDENWAMQENKSE